VEDHVQAKLFFDKIVMTEDNSRSYECRAMSELSQIAASRLLDIFMGKGRKKEQSCFNCFQKATEKRTPIKMSQMARLGQK